ncbi:MAG: hypothetical protein IJV39_03015 [Ruminococcus sp.]|nr:hypothetical protein [Ruminococcus sp.]
MTCIIMAALAVGLIGCTAVRDNTSKDENTSDITKVKALYEGVKNYGAEDVNKDTKEDFRYRFLIDGKENILKIDSGKPKKDGSYDYPIQNQLKENYNYEITIEDDTVIAATELNTSEKSTFKPVVSGIPGELTLGNFLKTAMEPVGTTLYIYGGGWDWQDEGSSIQARTIGVSSDWVKFFNEQDENFTYKSKDEDERNADPTTSYYPYGEYNEYYYAGLDCSGYVGWAIYNTLETESGKDGYVVGAVRISKMLSEMGYGEWTQDIAAPVSDNDYKMKPGDIMSLDGHVWISLGTCSDGSVVILHSTPAVSRTGQPGGGVEMSAIGLSKKCEAYLLADKYMSEYYPEWYERYPVKLADPETYFTFDGENAGRFTWNTKGDGLTDPENISDLEPSKVLAYIFESLAKNKS